MATPTKVEGRVHSDWLVYEEDGIGRYSRENVSVQIADGATIETGTVLEWQDAGKTIAVPLVGAAANGIAGIMINKMTNPVGSGVVTEKQPVLVRFARVSFENLVFAPAEASSNKNAAAVALEVAGIHFTDPQNVPPAV